MEEKPPINSEEEISDVLEEEIVLKEKEEEQEYEYLHLSRKEKLTLIGKFIAKWGSILLSIAIFVGIIVPIIISRYPWIFFEYVILFLASSLLLIGGCIGGLGRYRPAPKLRIIEPEDQGVIPTDFQIRVKYDPKKVNPDNVEVYVNDRSIPLKKETEENMLYAPKIFKTKPKSAISLTINAESLDVEGKSAEDVIKVICDPDEDVDDYRDYWEFKQETYWTKEMKDANRFARQGIRALQFIALSVVFLVVYSIFVLIRDVIAG